MTLSHIAGCRGIRDIAGLMSSLQGSINHLGGQQAPSKSTIAYQNQHRRWEVFRDAYYAIRKPSNYCGLKALWEQALMQC